jgi:two-component system, OmpR family, phosphate regulon sensor histidine kinase PhoR
MAALIAPTCERGKAGDPRLEDNDAGKLAGLRIRPPRMFQSRTIPVGGIALALLTGIVMAAAGTKILLVLAAMLVWIASLWLATPAPSPAAPRSGEGVQLTPAGMRDMIELSGLAMFILDRDRIIVANAAAREEMGGHIIGQDARVAFRHPAAVELLSRPEGGSTEIQGLTGPRSSWQMTRQRFDDRFSLVELVNRTAETDISRAHTDFVANASHELRTPLASIIGYVETLVDEGATLDAKQAARFHEIVLREARRLQDLVADLMSLSRIEAEKHDQPRERVDLSALVQRAANECAGPARQERLRIEAPDEPLTVRGDRGQLEQLVRNLVDNALKYGAAGSPVEIFIEASANGMATVRVRDHSEGVAAEHIPHLTRRFYRVDPSRSRAAGGTGLGLAIVKHIVERHRGRLDIASRIGEGTTVTVRVPMAD